MQDYDNWEMYIFDDASTDNSVEVAEKTINGDNRIKIIDVLKGSFQLILCSDTTTISYDLINTKIDFKIIEIENRNNLFFNEYNKKLYLNEIINKL